MRKVPTFKKLDSVLDNVEWERKFPLVLVHAMTRTGSDHTPIFIDSDDLAHISNNNLFSFELSWMRRDGSTKLVTNESNAIQFRNSLVKKWKK
jgi:hypothetical protein